jgi:hemerythrin-like domain-containing protein
MATALASTGMPPSGDFSCDAGDLLLIHRYFRSMFVDAQALVENAPLGDLGRAAVLADHITENATYLHTHHHGEDEFLWDKLELRTPSCSVHIEQMKVQHAQVAALLDAIEAALPAWKESAAAADRSSVADGLASLNLAFGAHLDLEEKEIIPVAETSVSQAEWDQLARHGQAATPGPRRFIQLGFILGSLTEEQRAAFMKVIPAPVRVLYRLVGKRQFDKQRALVYGTAA